ncbi:hypothetical protein HUE87_08435 [Candidatus Sulfurimonas marisnigri]|uniref:General glycosylation pathway protein n=1 Tax=Candidatus Sulfurimonas marisnigri TaxID=2740405 RepID=A0A7S7LYQ4_9BACT|nr:hypothetical protein [Candidatus Sulfurimonas marisnigri]QOY53920.1 hypothetical protein HUE87_08435 [Candidatus Sulfurimonas marisnigri]
MEEIITIYKKQRPFIENSLTSMVENIDLTQYDEIKEKFIFSLLPALKATYKINKNYKQSTPIYTEDGADKISFGEDRSYLLSRIKFRDDNIYISNSYVNSRTATPSITIVLHINNEYLVYDFELYALLKGLMLIGGDKRFTIFVQSFYGFFGFLLTLFSLSLIGYAIFIIYEVIIYNDKEVLSGFFRSIIALTLGLAIFDLAKTILEHEVFYKELSRNYNLENKLLARFLISIIVALSIEALMVVFKIVLSDYAQMIHAFYLISGIGIMIISLSIFIFIMRYQGHKN